MTLNEIIPALDNIPGQVSSAILGAEDDGIIPGETMAAPHGFTVLEKLPSGDWKVVDRTVYLNDIKVKDANGEPAIPTTIVVVRGPKGIPGKDGPPGPAGKDVYYFMVKNPEGGYTKIDAPYVPGHPSQAFKDRILARLQSESLEHRS